MTTDQKSLKLVRTEYPRIRVRERGNTVFYEVDCRSKNWTGQSFYSFQLKGKAIKKAQEIAELVSNHGKSGVNHEDIKLLARIRKKLVPFKIGVEEAVDRFIKSQENNVALQKSESISEVCELWFQSKHSPLKPLRKETIKQVKGTCNRLKKCFPDRAIGTIVKSDIEGALVGMEVENSSRKIYLRMFKSFFKYAKKQKFIRSNPCDDISVYSHKEDTLILDNDSLLKLLANLEKKPQLIPYITLCLFAGVRPSECELLEWKDIHLDDEKRQIYISHRISKVKTDRYTPISDCLAAWLKPYIGKPIKIANHRKTLDSVKEGCIWQKDIMRHTAISYFMGKEGNIFTVSEHLGNSPDIIKKHYQKAVLKRDTDFFWSLTPTKVKELEDARKKKEGVQTVQESPQGDVQEGGKV